MIERLKKGMLVISQSGVDMGQPVLPSFHLVNPFHVGVHGGDFFISRVRARHVFFYMIIWGERGE